MHIAKKLGFPDHLLEYAYQESYGDQIGEEGRLFLAQLEKEVPTFVDKTPKIEKVKEKHSQSDHALNFQRGDSVEILPEKTIGIVYQPCDEKGNIGVQIRGEKQIINHKRLQIKIKAGELYPEDYDFSIIFDSVEFRKAYKIMGKRYEKGLVITHDS